jgi:hypothetical protein
MTRDDIDRMLDLMADEAAKGDRDAAPGVIFINADVWVEKLPRRTFPTLCASPLSGIRYRGIRVLVSRHHESRVATRAECGDQGMPFDDLEPRSAA